MNAVKIKKEIHDFIDQADSRFLQLVYSMVKSERDQELFSRYTDEDMKLRASASLADVKAGRTSKLEDFKQEIDHWKKQRSTQ